MDININQIFTGVIIAILAGAFKYGRSWVLNKIAASKNALFVQYMGIVADITFDVVSAAMQSTVNGIKESNGGKLDKKLAEKIKFDVINSVKSQLSNKAIEYLEKATGTSIEGIIDTQVEKSVGSIK